MSGSRTFSGVDKAWYRFTAEFQKGFTTAGPGTIANAWKMMFGGRQRHLEILGFSYLDQFDKHGGSEQGLPNSDPGQRNLNPANGNTEWTAEEWWEWIIYEERVSATHFRVRV